MTCSNIFKLIVWTLSFSSAAAVAHEKVTGIAHIQNFSTAEYPRLSFKASLLDTSLADGPSDEISQQTINNIRQNTIEFTLSYPTQNSFAKYGLIIQGIVFDPVSKDVIYRTVQSFPVDSKKTSHAIELKKIKNKK